jgi:hypothetical protein
MQDHGVAVKPADTTVAKWGRGICRVCDREFNLLKNGKMGRHGKGPSVWPPERCDGAGDWPAPEVRQS